MKDQSAKPSLEALRHSCSHLLAAAVLDLYPDAKPTLGPPIDDGFYYDFDFSTPLSEESLPKIEKPMREIVKHWDKFERLELTPQAAAKKYADNPYKKELIAEHSGAGEKITLYQSGDFIDLCKGGHIAHPSQVIKHFKLLSVAGDYWRGSEKNKMLSRIYGTAFFTREELDAHLKNIEEAKKRDHRKIGKDLNLFVFSDLVGKGLPLWTENGATIYREIQRFVVDTEIQAGYSHVLTPNIAKTDLYKKSGHYPYYKNTMYPPMTIDEEELILRPMTCPHHFTLYMSQKRSYKELPLRFAEMASLYRYEKSGELTGLLRVREFCLADSHNFIAKEQAFAEVNRVLDLIEMVSGTFGLIKGTDYRYRLSLGDRQNLEKYYDAPEDWAHAENLLRDVLIERNAPYFEAKDEAAFYGPKIDIQMKNVNGKEDSAFTVQYDFCLPARFGLTFINAKGEEEQPIVIHRSSFGAMERSISYLIEHFAGAFPLWISPTQVVVIPIGQDHAVYAKLVHEKCKAANIRSLLWDQAESMQKRIRNAEKLKIPFMLIIGDKEVASETVSVRIRSQKDQAQLATDLFIDKVKHLIHTKSLNLNLD